MGNCEKCGKSIVFNCNHECTYGSYIFNQKNIINIMIIGDKDNEGVKNLTKLFQHHYFRENIEYSNNRIMFSDSKSVLNVTYSDFENLKNIHTNSTNFDLIISFENKKENNIKIIKYFGKTNYILKNLFQKEEIITECSNIISLNDLELTNHFRKTISHFLSWGNNSNNNTTNSFMSDSSTYSKERIKQYLICPIGGNIMVDPVSTPNGHIFERKNIEEEIRRRGKCPITGTKLKIEDLRPVINLKNLIQDYKSNMSYNSDL